MAGNHNAHGWTWVFGKNKNPQSKPIVNPFVKDVEKIAMSFFVTNFPESLDAKNLWKEFQRFGRIVDAFIANKRSKTGKCFSFVRFLGVRNGEDFAKTMSNIWIGSYHLFVSISKFERASKIDTKYVPKFNVPQAPPSSGNKGPSLFPARQSYASVANGGGMRALLMFLFTTLEAYGFGFNSKTLSHVKLSRKMNLSSLFGLSSGNLMKKDGEAESHTSNEEENPMDTLDDFVEQVVEEKGKSHSTNEGSHVETASSGGKPPGFENVVRKEDILHLVPTKEDSVVNSKEKEKKASDSDVSIPPGFKSLVKRDNECKCVLKEDVHMAIGASAWINGIFLSINIRGSKDEERKRLKSMWGNFNFDYACSMARGRSGGIITMWDPNVFTKNRIWCNDNYVIVEGKWKNSVEDYFLINVYGPQQQPEKYILWDLLRSFIQNHQGNFILFGDLNEVRCETERFGSNFSSSDAAIFNAFIQDVGLIDLPMGGKMFTWMNKSGSKLSKLDRFLISNNVLLALSNLQVTFKVYHSWFERCDFDNVVKETWNSLAANDDGLSLPLHEKVKDCHVAKSLQTGFPRASILVNGSPTSKFSLKRGLRQGDPLSPFLFIIVMEGLHIALKDGLTANIFQGLKINISKSNLYGVGVSSDDIESMAAGTGCSASNLPFSYLGLPIGSNMNRIANWNSLIERFKIRLSGWKANMLSSGGRLTLIKSVLGSLGIYYFSIFKVPEAVLKTLESLRASFFWGATGDTRKLAWIKWSNILASLDKGGLGVGIGTIYHLHSSGYVPLNSLRYQVGDGSMIGFWKDTWLGDAPLFSFILGNILIICYDRYYPPRHMIWCKISSSEVQLPIFGGLFVVGVSLKSRRYLPVMNGTYGTPRGKLQKSRKTELMSFSPPLVGCFGEVKKLQNQGVNIFDYIRIKIGNGDNTSFWKDKWHNEGVLKDVFPRLYALERHQNVTIHTKLIDYSLVNSFRRNPRSGVEEFQLDNLSRLVSTITLSSAVDRYVWSLENSGEFSVKSIRQVIDANCFPVIHSATRWVKSVPLKVNIMAWKIKMDGLPTRMNISRRGIEIDSIVCPICNSGAC
ncbi:RNA-directed DNA polymerase, eukaryota, reverse transcriptase zinc-binding domain protein [Tanacetum coccineum]